MTNDSLPTVESLEHEVLDLDRRLNAAKALLEAVREYQQLSGTNTATSSPTNKSVNSVSGSRARTVRTGPMHQTETAAAKIMESLGRPVATGEVISELVSVGAPLPHNASNVVSARMSNSPKFVGRRGIGWWFVDRPWPGDDQELFVQSSENV